jgi:tetratricopeptide (TPR) repeat protein
MRMRLSFSIHLFLLLSLVWLGGACALQQPPTAQPKPAPAIALLTYAVGGVKIVSARQGQASPAKAYASLYPGDRLELAEQAQATVICLDEHFLTLTGPATEAITPERCARAPILPADSTRWVKPDAGRIRVYKESLALEEQAREQEADYGNLPVILSPRHTRLLDLAPPVQWTAVAGALEYQLHLSGAESFADIVLDAATVACVAGAEAEKQPVCSAPWPAAWRLALGQPYFLTVSARTGIATPLRSSQNIPFVTLAAPGAAQVQVEVAGITQLALDPLTRALFLAGRYAEHELYAAAIPLYEQVLAAQPSPVLATTLGDLYRAIDLQRYAFAAYQRALDLLIQGADDPAVRAAAEFGLGQVEYSRGQFALAEPHFRQAVDLYTQLGAEAELLAAEKALEETWRRSKDRANNDEVNEA